MAIADDVETQHVSSTETVELFKKYVIGNYNRYPINLVRGEGSLVWDAEGNRYLDLFPGWGCNLLGHCPPAVVRAVQEQVATLIHVPNTWHMDVQGRWAQMLSERSFGGQAFFCNSGAEANEAAIKLARLHGGPGRYKIVTMFNSFHGRTLGALSLTASKPVQRRGFAPLLPGVFHAPYPDPYRSRGDDAAEDHDDADDRKHRDLSSRRCGLRRRASCTSCFSEVNEVGRFHLDQERFQLVPGVRYHVVDCCTYGKAVSPPSDFRLAELRPDVFRHGCDFDGARRLQHCQELVFAPAS